MENFYPFIPMLKPMFHLTFDQVRLTELEERKNILITTVLNLFQANVGLQFLHKK